MSARIVWEHFFYIFYVLFYLLEIGLFKGAVFLKEGPRANIPAYEVRHSLERVIIVVGKSVNFVIFFLMDRDENVRLELFAEGIGLAD